MLNLLNIFNAFTVAPQFKLDAWGFKISATGLSSLEIFLVVILLLGILIYCIYKHYQYKNSHDKLNNKHD